LTDAGSVFERVLGDRAELAVDRAVMELRAGRPIGVEAPDGVAVVAALDGMPPSLYDAFCNSAGGNAFLALSAPRAAALGLAADGAIALPIAGLGREAAGRLAAGRDAPMLTAWKPADIAGLAGIALCKQALLLPAALVAGPAPGDAPPATLHRVRASDVHAAPERRLHVMEIVSQAQVPIAGEVQARFVVFRGGPVLRDQIAIVVGDPDPGQPVLVRLHSACLTGDLFGSLRCDCGDQLRSAIACLISDGGGVLLYLDQEGRGIGIRNKMRAYALQDDGLDTIDADAVLGFGADERRYEMAAGMLEMLGFRRVRLLTNNPDKVDALKRAGLDVVGRRPLIGPVTAQNQHYLSTKLHRAGHLLEPHHGRDGGRRFEASS
jgi:GTP cyclohydrolase II